MRRWGAVAALVAWGAGCDGGASPPTDAAVDAVDAVAVDPMDADVGVPDAARRDVVSPDVGFDRPATTGDVGGGERVRSCGELMRFFDCEGPLQSCFQFDPSGDQGACDTPGTYCENWWNCSAPGNRRVLDWDCFCAPATSGPRWRCVVRAVCDAGVRRD